MSVFSQGKGRPSSLARSKNSSNSSASTAALLGSRNALPNDLSTLPTMSSSGAASAASRRSKSILSPSFTRASRALSTDFSACRSAPISLVRRFFKVSPTAFSLSLSTCVLFFCMRRNFSAIMFVLASGVASRTLLYLICSAILSLKSDSATMLASRFSISLGVIVTSAMANERGSHAWHRLESSTLICFAIFMHSLGRVSYSLHRDSASSGSSWRRLMELYCWRFWKKTLICGTLVRLSFSSLTRSNWSALLEAATAWSMSAAARWLFPFLASAKPVTS